MAKNFINMSSSYMKGFEDSSKLSCSLRAVHPKVLNALIQLRAPSPVKIPRDQFQPITGDLRSRIAIPFLIQEIVLDKPEPKQVSLNLSSSILLNRRQSNRTKTAL